MPFYFIHSSANFSYLSSCEVTHNKDRISNRATSICNAFTLMHHDAFIGLINSMGDQTFKNGRMGEISQKFFGNGPIMCTRLFPIMFLSVLSWSNSSLTLKLLSPMLS